MGITIPEPVENENEIDSNRPQIPFPSRHKIHGKLKQMRSADNDKVACQTVCLTDTILRQKSNAKNKRLRG